MKENPPARAPKWRAWAPLAIGFGSIGILVGFLGAWSISTEIAGAVVSPGMVELANNRQVVQHPEGGVVGEILAKDGDVVQAGEVVLRLDDTFTRSEIAILEGQYHEFLARRARLIAERDGVEEMELPDELARVADNPAVQELIEGQRRLFDARRISLAREFDQLSEQVAQTNSQIDGVEAQLTAYRIQEDLISRELADSLSLFEKGLTQAPRVSALQREQAGLQGEIGELQATAAQLKGTIAGIEIQKIRLATNRREEAITTLRDLRYQEAELSERLLSAKETLNRMEVRTPVSGVVYGSQVFAVHAVISPAAPIMYVIPQDQPLVIKARVDGIHIDEIYTGQPATLRFSTFDQRFTPEIFGTVTNISADILTDERTGVSYYEAQLQPNEGELAKLGGVALLPGMPAEAFIRTGDRTPLSYLAKPLTDYFSKAFRET